MGCARNLFFFEDFDRNGSIKSSHGVLASYTNPKNKWNQNANDRLNCRVLYHPTPEERMDVNKGFMACMKLSMQKMINVSLKMSFKIFSILFLAFNSFCLNFFTVSCYRSCYLLIDN